MSSHLLWCDAMGRERGRRCSMFDDPVRNMHALPMPRGSSPYRYRPGTSSLSSLGNGFSASSPAPRPRASHDYHLVSDGNQRNLASAFVESSILDQLRSRVFSHHTRRAIPLRRGFRSEGCGTKGRLSFSSRAWHLGVPMPEVVLASSGIGPLRKGGFRFDIDI